MSSRVFLATRVAASPDRAFRVFVDDIVPDVGPDGLLDYSVHATFGKCLTIRTL